MRFRQILVLMPFLFLSCMDSTRPQIADIVEEWRAGAAGQGGRATHDVQGGQSGAFQQGGDGVLQCGKLADKASGERECGMKPCVAHVDVEM